MALLIAISEQVKAFREEAKDYYHRFQGRRCCYCSIELGEHKAGYDAEHVLDKSTYPEFMFELRNICVACKDCNTAKSNKPVLANAARPAKIPSDQTDYLILHPHLDEWATHLAYDQIGRIAPNAASPKGRFTIEICGIANLNTVRLASCFLPGDPAKTEESLRTVFSNRPITERTEHLEFLRELATKYGLAKAKAVVQRLDAELQEHP